MTNAPLFKVQKIVQSMPLNSKLYLQTVITFRKHSLKLKDTLLQILDWWIVRGDFYQIGSTTPRNILGDTTAGEGKYLNTYFTLQPITIKHTRRVFGWLDLLGRLGGITNVMMILFGVFVYPISAHSFILKAAKKLFIARSKDPNMFKIDPK